MLSKCCFFSPPKSEAIKLSVPCTPFDSTLNRKYVTGLVFVYHILQLVNMCMLFITFVCLPPLALNSLSEYFLYTTHFEKVPPILHSLPF